MPLFLSVAILLPAFRSRTSKRRLYRPDTAGAGEVSRPLFLPVEALDGRLRLAGQAGVGAGGQFPQQSEGGGAADPLEHLDGPRLAEAVRVRRALVEPLEQPADGA